MGVHRLPQRFLQGPVDVLVVGCGGTGSALVAGLPYLHQALLAFGHPEGLQVTLMDGDEVSPSNCVRQPFTRSEIGLNKAVVLANRINMFWGFDWGATPQYLAPGREWNDAGPDIVIGAVDSRAARRVLLDTFYNASPYWLDFGNEAEIGQFVLGEIFDHEDDAERLPHVGDLFPDLLDPDLDADDGPSCSAAEALTRQAPFINQVLANHGLALLSRLFRYGQIDHHGGHINLETGRHVPRPVPPPSKRAQKRAARRAREEALA